MMEERFGSYIAHNKVMCNTESAFTWTQRISGSIGKPGKFSGYLEAVIAGYETAAATSRLCGFQSQISAILFLRNAKRVY